MAAQDSYPRPDFQRRALTWSSLDGPWDFAFDDADCGLSDRWPQNGIAAQHKQEIKVPFAFQTPASGIGKHEAHEVIWYERTITDIRTPKELQAGHRLLVRFGAVDYECSVWANGQFVGSHTGGHVPFDLDLTDTLESQGAGKKAARVVMRVRDSPSDLTQPRGKQYWKPVSENIFYTPTSGIWLSVWLESVPSMRLGGGSDGTFLRSDDIDNGQLHAQVTVLGRRAGTKCSVEIEATLYGVPVSKVQKALPPTTDHVFMDVDMRVKDVSSVRQKTSFNQDSAWLNGTALWHPEHPILYDLSLRLVDDNGAIVDEVQTMTGMRNVEWRNGDGTFRLNHKPYFQALVLDQGYWPETCMTPPSADALKADIEISMQMGFNGCRKHQKVEDPRFLYWANRLGYLVWGEIANAYEFDEVYTERFNAEWIEAVKRDINHPCIVTWTPNNESWAYTALERGVNWSPANAKRLPDGVALDTIEQRNHMRTLYYLTKFVSQQKLDAFGPSY